MQVILIVLVAVAALYAFLRISGSSQADAATAGIGNLVQNFDMDAVTSNPNFYPIVASSIIAFLIIFAWKNIPEKIKWTVVGGVAVYLIIVISSH